MSAAESTPATASGSRRGGPFRYTPEGLIALLQGWAFVHGGEPPSALEWTDAPGMPSIQTVTRHLGGTWSGALIAAGLETRHSKGGAPRTIGGTPCLNCGDVIVPCTGSKGRCRRCALFFRRSGGREWTPTTQADFYAAQTATKEERWREAVALRHAGWSDKEAAALLGVTVSTYSHRLTRARAAGFDVPFRYAPFFGYGCWVPRYVSDTWEGALIRDPCSYCGAPSEHVDHIEPRARGGADDDENLTGACASCNLHKNATPLLHFLLARA